jgi:hypothetical protein
MPLFHFVFHEDFAVETSDAIELEDHEQALAQAREAARETMADSVAEGIDPTGWVVRVYNDSEMLIGTIFFVDLLKPAQG